MSAPESRRFVGPNVIRLLVLLAFLCFVAAFCIAEGWNGDSDVGTWQEWIAGGLALHVLAELA